jgi:hypothetical protein
MHRHRGELVHYVAGENRWYHNSDVSRRLNDTVGKGRCAGVPLVGGHLMTPSGIRP